MTNPKVDAFLNRSAVWRTEMAALRRIALSCDLTEDLKWGTPCYTCNNRNIVLIHSFKDYCAFLFFKGALLEDPANLLVQQSENTQSARQIRFTTLQDISDIESTLKIYIQNAILIEKSGQKVEFKSTKEFKIPDEFQAKLKEFPELKPAFDSLTPGRQRAYLLHFGAPKQSKTRASRIEKSIPQILAGKGLLDT